MNKLNDLKLQLQFANQAAHNDMDFSYLNSRFANLTADPEISYMDLYADSNGLEILDNMVGQYQPGNNGRWFRLAKNGTVQQVVGNLLQGSADDSQFTGMSVLAASIATTGVQTVTVTLGTTTVNLNDFLQGSVGVSVTPDLCSDYVITGHTTGTSGQNIVLTLDRPLRNAWTTSTKVHMRRNPWSGVIQIPATTPTNMPVGWAVFATKASVAGTTTTIGTPQYSWIQTHGINTVLCDASAILKGSGIASGSGTAGAVQLHPFSGNSTGVGNAMMPNGSASKGLVVMCSID